MLLLVGPEGDPSENMFGLGTWELVLIIAAPLAVSCCVLMIVLSVRHQKQRFNRRMDDMEQNIDSADVPILGK